MLKAVNAKEFDMSRPGRVDRLGRSLTDLLGILQGLHDKGVDLFLHQQRLDTRRPRARRCSRCFGVFAEFERGIIRERVNAGRAPTEARPLRLSSRQARVDPFSDDAALELCKHAEHLEHRLARGRRRVEPLLMQEQIDALVMKSLQDAEQIPSAIGLGGRPTRPRPCRTLSRLPP